jgi:hypothetical protein
MIIGTRLLKIRFDGRAVNVEIRMRMPVGHDRTWSCGYEIDWPDDHYKSEAWGVDALQAIHLAMQKIASDLYASPYHKKGLLSWGESGGYGFPMTKNGRDLLVGYDKEFDG